MTMNCKFLLGLLAIGVFSTLPSEAQEYATLHWKPETGKEVKYQLKMSHLSSMGLIEISYPTTETVTEVAKERVVLKRVNGDPQVRIDGLPNDRLSVGVPDRSVHFSPDGRFLRADVGSPRSGRLASLASVVLLSKSVAYGETWVYRQNDDPETGANRAEFLFTYRGKEDYYGVAAHRIDVRVEETAHPKPVSADGTVWISPADGTRLGEVYFLQNADLGMGPMRLKLVREPADVPVSGQDLWQGRWKGALKIPTRDVLEIWLSLEKTNENTPSVEVDLMASDSPFGRATITDTAPRWESDTLFWNLDLLGQRYLCQTRFDDFISAPSQCRSPGGVLSILLERTLDTPWVPADLKIVSKSSDEAKFTEAFRQAVLSVAENDYNRFDRLFVDNPRGMQPNEIWRSAGKVLAKFGKIRIIEYLRREDPGVYLKVTFDRAEREFFLQLDGSGKLLELTYVPPSTPHEH